MLTWFMALIMVSSIFGFIIADQDSGSGIEDYNGFRIERSNIGYLVKLDKERSVMTADHPIAVESVQVDPQVWELLNRTRVLGVTYNESDSRAEVFGAAQFLLEKDLLVAPRIFVQRGLFNASGTEMQSMSCADASPSMPVLLIKVGDETKVYLDGHCIIAQGMSTSDVLRASDRIILGMAGVISVA